MEEILAEIDKEVAIDIETSGLDFLSDRLLLFQINTGKNIHVINCRKTNIKPIVKYLIDNDILVVGHNIKFDIKFILINTGLLITKIFDTMIAEALIYRGINVWVSSLSSLVEKYCGVTLNKTTRDLFIGADFIEITDEIKKYAEEDVRYLLEIKQKQEDVLKNVVMQDKIANLEFSISPVVAKMEVNGILFDRNFIKVFAEESKNNLKNAREDLLNLIITHLRKNYKQENINEIFNKLAIKKKVLLFPEKGSDEFFNYIANSININSSIQIKNLLLYIGLNIKDTNKKNLEKIDHPIIESLFRYRGYAKLISSFTEPLQNFIHPATGRIHTDFNQLGAISGRFSASKPNLQQTDTGSNIRRGFKAPQGRKLICADFSQQELRIMAAISGERKLIEAYKNKVDVHSLTASLIFHKNINEVTKEERQKGKSLNFAVIYGSTEYGIRHNFSIELSEARLLLEKFWKGYPAMKQFVEKVGNKIIEKGYSVTMYGRKRYFEIPKIYYSSFEYIKTINHIKRAGVNHIIQGTGADIIKLALLRIFKENPFGNKLDILLTVHDEIVCEADEDILEEAAEFIKKIMIEVEQPFLGEIPAEVDVKISEYWAK